MASIQVTRMGWYFSSEFGKPRISLRRVTHYHVAGINRHRCRVAPGKHNRPVRSSRNRVGHGRSIELARRTDENCSPARENKLRVNVSTWHFYLPLNPLYYFQPIRRYGAGFALPPKPLHPLPDPRMQRARVR